MNNTNKVIDIFLNSETLETIKNTAEKNGCTVNKNASLSEYTTFKTGGRCPLVITPSTVEGLKAVIKSLNENGVEYITLGNGSNCLAPDEGIDKVLIHIADGLTQLRLESVCEIYCGAGVKLASLCKFALDNSLSGLEFAYGIPGSCGGAVFMNAGAYGGEMKDVITKATHIDKNGNEGVLEKNELALSYRKSAYQQNNFIITGAVFKLTKGDYAEIKAKMDDFISRRKEKQPLEYPSAGSTFKRPEGHFAGALIEQCNLKGATVGGAQVSEKHAGFIINKGGASSEDILSLIEKVKNTVLNETGVTLEPEVRILK